VKHLIDLFYLLLPHTYMIRISYINNLARSFFCMWKLVQCLFVMEISQVKELTEPTEKPYLIRIPRSYVSRL